MAMTAQSSQHDDALQTTAARLIYILGLDDAMATCRSNGWPEVLRFVLAYKTFNDRQPTLRFSAHKPSLACHKPSQNVTNCVRTCHRSVTTLC